jgi:hypothetical protein
VAVQLLDDRARAYPPSTPTAVAGYLRAVRASVARVTASRQQFIRRIGLLMVRVRQDDTDGFDEAASEIGREAAAAFRYVRAEVAARPTPAVCEGCHEALLTWIDMLIASADVTAEIGMLDDPTRLREVQALLAEGRLFADRFRAQYERLVAHLRAQLPTRPRRRRQIPRLLPFGRPR